MKSDAKPDYGMMLTAKGGREDQEHHFLDIPLDHITLLNGDKFTAVVNIPAGKQVYAASFDFEMPLIGIIGKLVPKDVQMQMVRDVNAMDKYPWTIEFPGPIRLGLRAHLGKPQRCEDETFRPLVVDSVFKAVSPPKEWLKDS